MSAALIPDPRLLAPDPAAFPFALDKTLTGITFVPVTRADISAAPILDHRLKTDPARRVGGRFVEIVNAMRGAVRQRNARTFVTPNLGPAGARVAQKRIALSDSRDSIIASRANALACAKVVHIAW